MPLIACAAAVELKVTVPESGVNVPPLLVQLPAILRLEVPLALSVAVAFRVMEPVPSALAFVTASVPAFIVVPPVYVLAAERVRVPAPDLVMAPDPSMTPLNVRLDPAVSIWKAPVPLVAIVNVFVLLAVTPVYSNAPVVLLEPKVTLQPL